MSFENFEWHRFLTYLMIGFFAQLVDGSLGMAYGVSANAILLSAGMLPLLVTASIHNAHFLRFNLRFSPYTCSPMKVFIISSSNRCGWFCGSCSRPR